MRYLVQCSPPVASGYWGDYTSFLGEFDPNVRDRQVEDLELFTASVSIWCQVPLNEQAAMAPSFFLWTCIEINCAFMCLFS
jgi:hypothetical protein